MPTILFLYDVLRLDERMLLEKLRERFRVKPLYLPSSTLEIGGSREADIAVQRSVSYYRALTSSAVVESWGVPVVNSTHSIALSEDKVWSLSLLASNGIPVPRTVIAYTIEEALRAADAIGYPIVMKPFMGSWGRLAALARDDETLASLAEHREALGGPYRVHYLQEYIEKPNRDLRVMCIGDEVPVAIARVSSSWITNTARGGRAEPHSIDPELEDLVARSCRILGVEVGGVDVAEDPRWGYVVLEVNAVPEYKNIVRVTGVDVPGLIASYLYDRARR